MTVRPGIEPVQIRTAYVEERDAVYRLVRSSGLPTEGLSEGHVTVYVAADPNGPVATAALERYGTYGLLRSLCVLSGRRGEGLGRRMTSHVLQQAQKEGLNGVYLLTETAEAFFSMLGFQALDREQVPVEIRSSIEFASLCPSSAVAMAHMLS